MSLTQPAHADRTGTGSDVRIALLGCGIVGSGVARLLVNSTSSVPARSGVDYWLAGIAVRSLSKPRPSEIPAGLFTEDARALAEDPSIDVVIECIGGTGIAADLVVGALSAGKHVVTANKDLLATRGPELRALAASRGVTIAYEAAVGGAIPIVRTIAESLAGEDILEVGGVLNGTTNFILSEMFEGATYRAPSPPRNASVLPKPIRPTTSKASTPRISSRSSHSWRSVADSSHLRSRVTASRRSCAKITHSPNARVGV